MPKLEFDPNKLKRDAYASYVPGRRPPFKLHNGRGPCVQVGQVHDYFILYRWLDNKWKEIYRQEEKFQMDSECFFCKKDMGEKPSYNGNPYFSDFGGTTNRVTACYDCIYKENR